MSVIEFENGKKVEFEGTPTQQDVEEVAAKLGVQSKEYASPLQRAVLSFGDAQGREKYMQEHGLQEGRINKPGLDVGDITSKAGGAFPWIAGMLGAVPGATAGSVVPGAGTVVGAGLTAAPAAAAGEGVSQAIGQALGVRDVTEEGGQEESLKDVGEEALLAGIAPGVGKAAVGTGKLALGGLKGGSRQMMRNVVRPSSELLGKYQNQGIDLLEEWTKLNVRGSAESVTKQAFNIGRKAHNQVDDILEASSKKVPLKDAKEAITKTAADFADKAYRAGDDRKAKTIMSVAKRQISNARRDAKGNEVSLKSLNNIKRNLQKAIKDKYGTEEGVAKGQQVSQNALKELIENYEPAVAAINRQTQIANALGYAMKAGQVKSPQTIAQMFKSRALNFLSMGLGGIAGYKAGGLAGSYMGGQAGYVGASALQKALGSTPATLLRMQGVRQLERIPTMGKSTIGNIMTQGVDEMTR